MSAEHTIDIGPSAHALIDSLRGLGYSPETALADLIDNSISAGAKAISIDVEWNDGTPVVALLDDGVGMSAVRLRQALRFGDDGPIAARPGTDLGRFGMGMKTASLSQSRRFSVITKDGTSVSFAALDMSVIEQHGWVAVLPSSLPSHPLVQRLLGGRTGTAIIWEQIDELSGLTGLPKEAFYLRLEGIRAHLGMVFHRFIDGDGSRITVSLNGRPVRAWDPFQTAHPATIEMPLERLRCAGGTFTVKPYILPHRDRFVNEAAYLAAGGPDGWSARQGFYVYRAKRLLVAGSWLGLGGSKAWTREEASRLARLMVDLPTTMDRSWGIDVRKFQARPPGALRARLTDIAFRCRAEAREVFAFRGQRPRARTSAQSAPPIWIATPSPRGNRYRINRDHPAIIACQHTGSEPQVLAAVLSLIERSVPVERIWFDVSESEGVEPCPLSDMEIEQVSGELARLAATLPEALTTEQRLDALLLALPGNLEALRASLMRKLGSNQ